MSLFGQTPALQAKSEAGRKHILLVEDEPYFRSSAKVVLNQSGYRISEAANGSDALRLIRDSHQTGEKIDLMVADMLMPLMSGVMLLKQLRGQGIIFPTLVITAFSDVAVLKEVQRIEQADILLKPFNPKEFAARVAEMLSSSARAGPDG